MAGIRLGSGESARAFKGIICDDISEFESYMASHAVGLSQVLSPRNRHAQSGDAAVIMGGDFAARLDREQNASEVTAASTEDDIGAFGKSHHRSRWDTSELGQEADAIEGTPTHAKVYSRP